MKFLKINCITTFLFFLVACGPEAGDLVSEKNNEVTWYQPTIETTWQWQLTGEINTNYDVDVYDIDLFETPQETIDELHGLGRKVICYFSAGSFESFRPDADKFFDGNNDPKGFVGNPLEEPFEEEKWLDIRAPEVIEIMKARLDLAVEKKCDGVEPDNVDGFTNVTGFELTAEDQLAFNKALANEAHKRNLAVGLKNDGDQAAELVDYFDFSLNEQCHEFSECNQLSVFIENNKPVFNAEYNGTSSSICSFAKSKKFRTLILPLDLDDSSRASCDEI